MPNRYSSVRECIGKEYYDLLYDLQRNNGKYWRRYYWPAGRGDYKRFYGVFSIDGKAVCRLMFKPSFPKRVLAPVFCDPNGQYAIFSIGRAAKFGGGEHRLPGDYEYVPLGQLLVWTRRGGTKEMSVKETANLYPALGMHLDRFVSYAEPRAGPNGEPVTEE
jgi:hypothetical protein